MFIFENDAERELWEKIVISAVQGTAVNRASADFADFHADVIAKRLLLERRELIIDAQPITE